MTSRHVGAAWRPKSTSMCTLPLSAPLLPAPNLLLRPSPPPPRRLRLALRARRLSFGIRTIRFDADRGFFLNDQPLKLKGVCVHQDAGSVGGAVPEAVWERRLRALKDLGVNAIRTSHNPPAPEFLDLCDRLGLLVKDEAFDEFTPTKNKWVNGRNIGVPSRFGYGENFAEWSVRDAGDMVRRDRNHPSMPIVRRR